MFGEAFSRDIEPSKESGALLYDIMASCIRMFRAGARSCTAAYAAEACCVGKTSLKSVSCPSGPAAQACPSS